MKLDLEDGMNLIQKANEKINKEKAWQMWLTLYPKMNADNFIPFSEFYKVETVPQFEQKKRTQLELKREAAEIRRKFSGG